MPVLFVSKEWNSKIKKKDCACQCFFLFTNRLSHYLKINGRLLHLGGKRLRDPLETVDAGRQARLQIRQLLGGSVGLGDPAQKQKKKKKEKATQ